jgi:hypothetical protein
VTLYGIYRTPGHDPPGPADWGGKHEVADLSLTDARLHSPAEAPLGSKLVAAVLLALATVGACGRLRPAERLERGPWVRTALGYEVRGWMRVTRGDPDTLRFGASVRNPGERPVRVSFGGIRCLASALAYRTAAHTGRPVWDSEQVWAPTCELVQHARSIAPGDTFPTDLWTVCCSTSLLVLGDSLPEGRYYFSVSPPLDMDPEAEWPPPRPEFRIPSVKYSPPVRIYVPAGSAVLTR